MTQYVMFKDGSYILLFLKNMVKAIEPNLTYDKNIIHSKTKGV